MSHISDKKFESERQKLVEQARRIAQPSKGKETAEEIRLFNSMVIGIQNYYKLATCISLDCRIIHRQIMTVLTNRLHEGRAYTLTRDGTLSPSEKERFGKSKMVRFVAGLDLPIYPLAFIRNKVPHSKRSAVCSYTVEGRALIHTNLMLNNFVLKGLRDSASEGHCIEFVDSELSLFSAQHGKCAISGEEFSSAADIIGWLKIPASIGGCERYRNMTLIHRRYLPYLSASYAADKPNLTFSKCLTQEEMSKINGLRKQAGLSLID